MAGTANIGIKNCGIMIYPYFCFAPIFIFEQREQALSLLLGFYRRASTARHGVERVCCCWNLYRAGIRCTATACPFFLPEFRFADVVARAHMKHLSLRKKLFDRWAQTFFGNEGEGGMTCGLSCSGRGFTCLPA